MTDSRKAMRKKRNSANGIGCLIVLILLFGALAGGYFVVTKYVAQFAGPIQNGLSSVDRIRYPLQLFMNRNELVNPVSNMSTEKEFKIEMGESPYSIAERLETDGIIQSGDVMVNYLVYSGKDTELQQGEFVLDPSKNIPAIVESLMNPIPTKGRLVILPGWRLEEIAASLPTSGLEIEPDEFLKAAKSALLWSEFEPTGEGVEGFLFPGDYTFERNISADSLVLSIVEESQAQLSEELIVAFKENDLSVYQAVILASIVEKESVVESEMPMIASVFFNRLRSAMLLQTDPTVQYAIGQQSDGNWWKVPLEGSDLEVLSPYNTYKVYGLPPTPIGAPSSQALQAVAYPEDSDFFYFQSVCDNSGLHTFSETYAEHLDKLCP